MASLNVSSNLTDVLIGTTSVSINVMADEEAASKLHQISSDIRDVYLWVVFALGFPGNCLCIITVLTMQSMTAATFFTAVLAMCDGATLAVKLIGFILSNHQVYLSTFSCKILFMPIYLSTLASWILVLICTERFVSVCFPLQRNAIFTNKRSYVCVGVISASLFIFFAVIFSVMRDVTADGLQCGTPPEYYDFWMTAWKWINMSLFLLIPFPCIVVLTALIIRGLRKSQHDRRSLIRNGDASGNGCSSSANNQRLMQQSERLERTITIMLIFAAVIFLVLTLPACVYIVAKPSNLSSPLEAARWSLFRQIQYVLIDSSHAINFFLYFFSARRFRQQLYSVLRCRTCKPNQQARKRTDHYANSTNMTTKCSYIRASHDDVSHV